MSIKIALVGNPNSGKTTLFNALTGSNQFVGNWPGVTVEKKEGKIKGEKDVILTDLPGIYSLSPYTLEEVVARNYLLDENPDVIINIIDGTNIERNLYLTTQILELGIPVILAVNLIDAVEKKGDKININKLGEALGCKAVSISALKGSGIQELIRKAVELARSNKKSKITYKFSSKVENAIDKVEDLLGSEIKATQKRFFAIKLIERDTKAVERLEFVPDIDNIIDELEKVCDDDVESIIANERYTYITNNLTGYIKKNKSARLSISEKIDNIVTNRIAAIPIFAIVMFLVYFIAVTTVGGAVTDWTNDGLFGEGFHLFGSGSAKYEKEMNEYAKEYVFTETMVLMVAEAEENNVTGADKLLAAIYDEDFFAFDEAYAKYIDNMIEADYNISYIYNEAFSEQARGIPDTKNYGVWVPGVPVLIENLLDKVNCADWLKSLVLDGIVAGVGAVLGFVPQMLVLFLMLGFLESCGYMSRVAFIMDKIFHKFGLSGKSFIPMLVGVGCGVPGIMASRTIENDRDRKITIITTTFIPCGAKLPIIALVASALFDGAWWLAPVAYFIGIGAVIVSGVILKKTKLFAGDPSPFVMELPEYHMPTVGNLLRGMWERGWSFIKKAGTVILLSTIFIWVGSRFGRVDGKLGFALDMELNDSVLGLIGNAIKIVFEPLGFGNATAVVATIMGLVAKEEVVAVLGILDFAGMTKIAAFAFMIFNLLCAPCFAAMGAIKREMNSSKWFLFAIGYQCGFAYVISLIVYQLIGLLVGEVAFSLGTVVGIILLGLMIFMLFRPQPKVRKVS